VMFATGISMVTWLVWFSFDFNVKRPPVKRLPKRLIISAFWELTARTICGLSLLNSWILLKRLVDQSDGVAVPEIKDFPSLVGSPSLITNTTLPAISKPLRSLYSLD